MGSLKAKSIIISIIFISIVGGCSSEKLNVIEPSNAIPNLRQDSRLPVAVSDCDLNGNPIAGQGFLGLFTLHIDSINLTGELIPLRDSSLVDVLEVVDITNFLQLAPCTNCAKIMSVELDPQNHLHVKIGIKHPFGPGDPLKPISGKNRADLHVFNVEGIVISDGTEVKTFSSLKKSIGLVGLINADGYTGYLDDALDAIFETQANLHPYILHFDDYSAGNFNPSNPMGFSSVTIPPPFGNLVMAMGCDYDVKDYIFDLNGEMRFIYAVGCTYAVSAATKAERFSPQYRIPQHNKKAASEVSVIVTNNQLFDGDETSFAELEIRVVDINHGVETGDALNQMFADSSVRDISVEVAGITTSSVSFGNTPVSGTGHNPSDPLIFTGRIYNTAQAPEGSYIGLVKVLDNYNPGLNGAPLLQGKDGIQRVSPLVNPLTGLFTINEFATYMPFTIDVASLPSAPVAVLNSNPEPPDAFTCQFIRFDASSSYDPRGYNIVSYEWDWDYTGNPSDFTPDKITASAYEKHQYHTAGSHITGLRVVNDATPPQTSEPISLTHILIHPQESDYISREVNAVTSSGTTQDIWMPGSNAIVVDDNNVVHIFTKVDSSLFHYAYDDGTVTSQNIGNIASYAHQSAVIDSKGVIHVMWYGGNVSNNWLIYYSNNSTGTFSTPQDVGDCFETGSASPYSYSLGINGQDELMFVWQELFTANDLMGYIYKFGDTWSSPAILTDPPCSTGSPSSRLAIMLACEGTPGDAGRDFHNIWTQQYTDGYMNPVVTYSKFNRNTLSWSTPEHVAPDFPRYQDWSDIAVTADGDVFVGSSYAWSNAFAARKDAVTGVWTKWWIAQTPSEEYTSTIGANLDGTVCIAYWERIGYPDPDPFEIQFKVFNENMTQAQVNAIQPQHLDPSTTYEFRFGDIFTKECNFYVAFMDRRQSLGTGGWEIYFARIGHQ